jgi:hypothetical protein
VLPLVVGEDLVQLPLLGLLDLGLLAVDEGLLSDLLLLVRNFLGHLLLDGRLLRLLLRDLVSHKLALLVDLLHHGFVLGAELRVLGGDIPALFLSEALAVFVDLLPDLRQVRLEIRNYVLTLDFLGHDDTLMVLFEGLVLVLVLAGQDLILIENNLSAALLLIIDIAQFVE